MEGRLSQVCALVDSKAKSEQYAALLDALISTGDTHGIDVFLQHGACVHGAWLVSGCRAPAASVWACGGAP